MKLIYVAGPFRGKTTWEVENNIRRAEELGFEVAKLGAVPIIPHTAFRHFDRELTEEFWLDGTLEMMRRCDGAIFLPTWTRSAGATGERTEARLRKMPIFDTLEQLNHWLQTGH